MSWKAKIFKPGWESRNSDKRIQSINTENSQGFWNALPSLIAEDPDYQVRLAAFKRLISVKSKDPLKRFDFTLQILESLPANCSEEALESYEKFRQTLKQQLLQWVNKLALQQNQCQGFIQNFCTTEQIQGLAKKAGHCDVRATAIGLVTANGVLGDIAIAETNPQLRRQAVSKIEQRSTLSRVAKAIRTRDKKLYKQIQESIFVAEDHNTQELAAHLGDEICQQLEQMIKQVGTGIQPDPSALIQQWEKMQSPVDQAQQQRYQTLLKTLQTALDGSAIQIAPITEPPETLTTTQETNTEPQTEVRIDAEKVSQQSQQKARTEQAEQRQQVIRARAEKQAVLQTDLNLQQDQLAELIEAGDLRQAVKLLQSLRVELAAYRKQRPPRSQLNTLEGRQLRLHGRIKKLRDYQHWANNKIRTEMIEKLQGINITELHPDAVKTMLVDARKQWQALEAGEQLPGDKYFHAPASLWRQFNQTCELASNMIQPFLEKRQQVQTEHLEEDLVLLNRGKELLATADPATRDLIQHQRELRTAIRALEKIPAKQRGKTARRIREQLGQLQEIISRAFDKVKTEKSRLIRQAEQLKHIEDKQEAINQAKQLQRQWQVAGSGSRKVEQPLWETFRSLLDPLFAEQAEEINAQQAEAKQQLEQLTAIYKQLQAVTKLNSGEALTMGGKVQSLLQEWQEHGGNALPHKDQLKLSFNRAEQQFQNILQQGKQQQAIDQRKIWQHKDQVLQQLHDTLQADSQADTSEIIASWPETDNTTPIDTLLAEKFEKLQSTGAVAEDKATEEENTEACRRLCLSLEYLAGLESPATEKQLRMDMQIQRLAGNLSGESARLSLAEEAAQLEQQWYALPLVNEQHRNKLSKRFHAAISEINEQLSHL